MSRRRTGNGRHVGGGGAGNPASLANLKRGDNPAPAGNRLAVTHGGFAAVAEKRLDAKVREVYDALAADAPLRAHDGGLPREDTVAVAMLAKALCRLEDVERDVAEHGWKDRETGAPRPALDRERQLRQEVADWLDALGMTPRSRSKLGLDLARTVSAATAMSEPNPELRRRLLRQAGVADGDGEES